MNNNSSLLLNSKTSAKWNKIGTQRRAGVALPLFSVYSDKSIGAGEIPDLRYVIDWCKLTGLSVLQLLPLNELGFDFAPYNAVSTFALEPMYLSLKKLRMVDLKPFSKDLRNIKKKFSKGTGKVNYSLKNEKIKLLRKIFDTLDPDEIDKYRVFVEKNVHWLKYYSLFKILTKLHEGKNWQEWELKYKYFSSLTAEKILCNNSADVKFYYWMQWQLYEQFITIKKYAKSQKILIMGDLPFLVSRNSADVWAYKNYFKLDMSSGAPPDMYFSKGQKWGMPPYNWENISADNYGYLSQRLKYAENFYDMFRIDHFVGLFRVWTIDLKSPEEFGGLNGKFDPENEYVWEEHGRNILTVMNDNTSMLPCAEDLGTVPDCSEKVLNEFGVTGINVQRWEKIHTGNHNFIPADEYRFNSTATVSTHDSSSLPAWWKYEAGSVDEIAFKMICENLSITDLNFFNLRDKLFDIPEPYKGKLFWKKGISNVYVLLEKLNMDYSDAMKIIGIYLSSFGEKDKYLRYTGLNNKDEYSLPEDFMKRSLEKINSANSVFSIQLMMEYLYLDKDIIENFSDEEFRINFPGTVSGNNWSMVIPVPLEKLKDLKINKMIKDIIVKSERF